MSALPAAILICASLLLSCPAFAQSTDSLERWLKVGELRGGKRIRVEPITGERRDGVIETFDRGRLTLREGTGKAFDFERSSVKRVSRKSRGRGALYGFLAGFTAGFATGAAAGPYITDVGNPSAARRAKYGLGWGGFFGGVGAGIGALAGVRVTVYP